MTINIQNLHPDSTERVCGNTYYVNLYSGLQITQVFQVSTNLFETLFTNPNFKLWPVPRPIKDRVYRGGRLVDTAEYFRIKRDPDSAGWQVSPCS